MMHDDSLSRLAQLNPVPGKPRLSEVARADILRRSVELSLRGREARSSEGRRLAVAFAAIALLAAVPALASLGKADWAIDLLRRAPFTADDDRPVLDRLEVVATYERDGIQATLLAGPSADGNLCLYLAVAVDAPRSLGGECSSAVSRQPLNVGVRGGQWNRRLESVVLLYGRVGEAVRTLSLVTATAKTRIPLRNRFFLAAASEPTRGSAVGELIATDRDGGVVARRLISAPRAARE
jgi:hypothetical protein